MSRATRPPTSPTEFERVIALLGELGSKLDVVIELLGREAAQSPPTPDDPLLGPKAVAKLVEVNQRTLRRMRSSRQFPPPTIVGKRPRWRRSEIDAWLAERQP